MPRPHRRTLALLVALICAACPIVAQASAEGHGAGPEVWITLAAMLLLAKLGGEVAVRLGQPAVLGELFAGIVLGNLKLAGLGWFVGAEAMPAIEFLAEFGVVLLLFEVGLESTVSEMRKVAPQSGLVAIIGVVAPMVLGFFGSYWLMPQGPISLHLFIGATLCATSVGITARVLKDLGVLDRQETKVVLGAAVIDDVLGLVVLAIVSAVAMHGTMPNTAQLSTIIALA
ncbi:MAG: cation:proton antiporter, partial [Polyangiales bacterium]